MVPLDDDDFRDLEPIKFTWDDPAELFEFIDAAEDAAGRRSAGRLRPRARDPDAAGLRVPAGGDQLAPVRAASRCPCAWRRRSPPRLRRAARDPARRFRPPRRPAARRRRRPAAAPRRRSALAGPGVVVAVAAAAAMITNALRATTTPSTRKAAAAGPALSAAERDCMKEWNTTAGRQHGRAARHARPVPGRPAQVARVKPLPGTVMAPDSCALTVYDPASDTRAVFVSGVKDQIGLHRRHLLPARHPVRRAAQRPPGERLHPPRRLPPLALRSSAPRAPAPVQSPSRAALLARALGRRGRHARPRALRALLHGLVRARPRLLRGQARPGRRLRAARQPGVGGHGGAARRAWTRWPTPTGASWAPTGTRWSTWRRAPRRSRSPTTASTS